MRSRGDIGRCMHHSGDPDLGACVAAQMHEVCDRLPVPVAYTALARYGFIEPWRRHGLRKSGFVLSAARS
jgi:hypothetical protein